MSHVPPDNPYHASGSDGFDQSPPPLPQSTAKTMAPAIAIIVVGSMGLIISFVSIGMALLGPAPAIDPNAPELLQNFQQGSHGPVAAAVQGAFILLNGFIIFGGYCFLKLRGWGIALAATILAMINFGNCCCLIGLPIGIWGLVILLLQDVKQAFARNSFSG